MRRLWWRLRTAYHLHKSGEWWVHAWQISSHLAATYYTHTSPQTAAEFYLEEY